MSLGFFNFIFQNSNVVVIKPISVADFADE